MRKLVRHNYLVALVGCAVCAPLRAQNPAPAQAGTHAGARSKTPPSDSILAAITERGRRLAEYDAAAWHATDAVQALPDIEQGSVTRFIARKVDPEWVVVFGHPSAKGDTFYVAYEAQQVGGDTTYVAKKLPAPRADTRYYAAAARAIELALADFGRVTRPYNVAALHDDLGDWWVYVVPAPTTAGVWPLGGDARYRVTADGRWILERRRLHNGISEFRGAARPGPTLKAGTHTAVLDDLPEDTDVFHILTRTPRVPEYVVSNTFIYRIDVDGSIKVMGWREDLLRSP